MKSYKILLLVSILMQLIKGPRFQDFIDQIIHRRKRIESYLFEKLKNEFDRNEENIDDDPADELFEDNQEEDVETEGEDDDF